VFLRVAAPRRTAPRNLQAVASAYAALLRWEGLHRPQLRGRYEACTSCYDPVHGRATKRLKAASLHAWLPRSSRCGETPQQVWPHVSTKLAPFAKMPALRRGTVAALLLAAGSAAGLELMVERCVLCCAPLLAHSELCFCCAHTPTLHLFGYAAATRGASPSSSLSRAWRSSTGRRTRARKWVSR
jgi:hypothetical protein